MKQASENRFSQGNVGESVAMKISDVNRARSNFRNIIGFILSGISTNHYYLSMLVLKNNLLWIYINSQ